MAGRENTMNRTNIVSSLRLIERFIDGLLMPVMRIFITLMIWCCFSLSAWSLFRGEWTDSAVFFGLWLLSIAVKGWVVDLRPSFSRQLFLMIRFGAKEGFKRSSTL